MKSNMVIVCLLVAILVISTAGLVLEVVRPLRRQRVVAATGVAQMTVRPDIIHLDLGVQTDALAVQKAQQANTAAMNQVLAAVKAQGVKESGIQTSSFYVSQNFDYSSGESKPIGWRVTNTVTVTATPQQASAIIDTASKAGANVFNSITYDISNQETLKAGLMKKAMANARAKAQGALEGTTHTLGDISSISADWSEPSVISPAAEGQGGSSGSPSVYTGGNILSVSVSVVFGLR